MPNITAVLAIGFAVILAGFAAWRLVRAWWTYRGRMVIACPENQQPAGVSVDARHAAATALAGNPQLRLSDCSRWPERAGCGQQCLSQIEAAPEDCLVHHILAQWYAGKSCAWCGQPLGEIHVAERKPTLLLADQSSMEWNEIPAERLQETLATALPLCFGCHIANTMRREHPELVIDRSRPALSGGLRGPHAP
ncbi:MAG: hypothetical protein LAP40_18070 [Acidobacteriia bacterium]|nr:hypothetical protein [Terriglobia bacterium]